MLREGLFGQVYKGRKVFLTGHTGFKGSWLSLWLGELGADVTGYSLEPDTDPSMFSALGIASRMRHVAGDIRDAGELARAVEASAPEIVFHMAAQPLVRRSYREPRETFETNVMGTVNLLEAVRASRSVKAVVVITSDKCYRNNEWVYGYREDDPMGGYDPYSASKGAAELVTSSYGNSFFGAKDFGASHNVALASSRAGNVIGGGDWAEDRLIPDCARSLSQGRKIEIRNPGATRPWQHVLEPLSGYLLLGSLLYTEGPRFAGGWNFGPLGFDHLTVEQIVKRAVEIWGGGEYYVVPDGRFHEANLLRLDISKACTLLGWRPVYDSGTALAETIEWYREYYSGRGAGMLEFSLSQLRLYVRAMVGHGG